MTKKLWVSEINLINFGYPLPPKFMSLVPCFMSHGLVAFGGREHKRSFFVANFRPRCGREGGVRCGFSGRDLWLFAAPAGIGIARIRHLASASGWPSWANSETAADAKKRCDLRCCGIGRSRGKSAPNSSARVLRPSADEETFFFKKGGDYLGRD